MKIKFSIIVCLFFQTTQLFSQVNQEITPDIRAYLFHIVRKSPILERNIGKAFEYQGPIIYFDDKSTNYDSIDRILINNPQLLHIRKEELSKSPKGVLTEASNKTAIYEMCKQIQRYKEGEPIASCPLLDAYFTLFFDTIPNEFLRGKNYELLLDPNQSPILQTNFSLNERMYEMSQLGIKSTKDQKNILDAQQYAINKAIENRTRELFLLLGGQSDVFSSILLAAGDGSYSQGLLEERDKDENGDWNKGLPKAIGLFPYEMQTIGTKKPILSSKRIVEKEFLTVGQKKQTQLHFDIWGYNSAKQTTVIIEKGNFQYPLFGSQTTRFLSPDSTFSKGTTFMKVLSDLDDFTFKELKKKIEGKAGLNEQILEAKNQLGEIENLINQKEGEFGELHKDNYYTKSKPSREMRKRRRQNPNGGPVDITPTTKARNKAKNKKQWELVDLYGMYDEINAHIDELIEERKPLSEEFEDKKKLIKHYEAIVGKNWCPFIVKDGLYIFSDGSKFDIYTQEFTFPPTEIQEPFVIRLLSIPEDFEGENSDEIMMHLSHIDAKPFYDADFEINFEDLFASDQYNFSTSIFDKKDTLFFKKLFSEFKKNTLNFELDLEGMGVGVWQDSLLIRDKDQKELASYPGNTLEEKTQNRNLEAFKTLRHTGLYIKLNRSIQIKIVSSTDPVVSNLKSNFFNVDEIISNQKISKNELLSALRTYTVLQALKTELTAEAPRYLSTSEAKRFIDLLDSSVQKSKIRINDTLIKLPKKIN